MSEEEDENQEEEEFEENGVGDATNENGEGEEEEEEDMFSFASGKWPRDFPPLQINIPKSVAKKARLDEDEMTIAQLQTQKVLRDTFNEGKAKAFDTTSYLLTEQQNLELAKHANEVPELLLFKENNVDEPLSMVKGQIGKAIGDKALHQIQLKTRMLEKLQIGVLLELAKGNTAGAMENALEVQGGLFQLESLQHAERARNKNPRKNLNLVSNGGSSFKRTGIINYSQQNYNRGFGTTTGVEENSNQDSSNKKKSPWAKRR
jgi:hypothetical protein